MSTETKTEDVVTITPEEYSQVAGTILWLENKRSKNKHRTVKQVIPSPEWLVKYGERAEFFVQRIANSLGNRYLVSAIPGRYLKSVDLYDPKLPEGDRCYCTLILTDATPEEIVEESYLGGIEKKISTYCRSDVVVYDYTDKAK